MASSWWAGDGVEPERRQAEHRFLAGLLPSTAGAEFAARGGTPDGAAAARPPAAARRVSAEEAEAEAEAEARADGTLLLQHLVLRLLEPVVEEAVGTLFEHLVNTPFATGREMAADLRLPELRAVQALTASDRRRVEEARAEGSGAVVEVGDFKLGPRDLRTLAPSTWLNDEVINAFFHLLVARAEEVEEYPTLHALSSHWFTRLAGPTAQKYDYPGVRRWTKKVDVFAYDYVLIPINWNANHWTLAAVDMTARTVSFYDSMSNEVAADRVAQVILRWLADEHRQRKQADLPASFSVCPPEGLGVPQQDNGYDCGIFTCSFANSLSAGCPISMAQQDAHYLRYRVALELLAGRAPVPW